MARTWSPATTSVCCPRRSRAFRCSPTTCSPSRCRCRRAPRRSRLRPPGSRPYSVEISVGFIALIAFGNLKGVRESGKIFAVPTYFFIVIMGVLLLMGFYKAGFGDLAVQSLHHKGALKPGNVGDGIFYGATLYVILHAFASGGAAVTGVEAISNGVTAFKKPEWKNARVTLVIMGCTLGTMFLGLSILASKVHAIPYTEGTPTVISQVGKLVFGGGAFGNVLFYGLQAGTMLILVLAANTSFADFPRLASFHAGDNFMPKQLTKRGHRLVFSNGIIFARGRGRGARRRDGRQGRQADPALRNRRVHVLHAVASGHGQAPHHAQGAALAARAVRQRDRRGPLADRRHHHRDHQVHPRRLDHHHPRPDHGVRPGPSEPAVRDRGPRARARRRGRRARSRSCAVTSCSSSCPASTRRRRARIQYARALMPDEMRAVHIAVDRHAAEQLADEWRRLGLSRVPLELVDCPDRRVAAGRTRGRRRRDRRRPDRGQRPAAAPPLQAVLAPAAARQHRRRDRRAWSASSRTPTSRWCRTTSAFRRPAAHRDPVHQRSTPSDTGGA